MAHSTAATADERYLKALAGKDFAAIRALLSADVTFRALIPSGLRQAKGADEATAMIQQWYADCDVIEVLSVSTALVGDRNGVSYRLRVHENDAWYTVGQQVFYTVKDGKVIALDLLCSGFRPDSGT
jgi:hypothetical protein